jgi:hypothetical protein
MTQLRPFYVLSVMEKRQARNSGCRKEDIGWWDPNPGMSAQELPALYTLVTLHTASSPCVQLPTVTCTWV